MLLDGDDGLANLPAEQLIALTRQALRAAARAGSIERENRKLRTELDAARRSIAALSSEMAEKQALVDSVAARLGERDVQLQSHAAAVRVSTSRCGAGAVPWSTLMTVSCPEDDGTRSRLPKVAGGGFAFDLAPDPPHTSAAAVTIGSVKTLELGNETAATAHAVDNKAADTADKKAAD